MTLAGQPSAIAQYGIIVSIVHDSGFLVQYVSGWWNGRPRSPRPGIHHGWSSFGDGPIWYRSMIPNNDETKLWTACILYCSVIFENLNWIDVKSCVRWIVVSDFFRDRKNFQRALKYNKKKCIFTCRYVFLHSLKIIFERGNIIGRFRALFCLFIFLNRVK